MSGQADCHATTSLPKSISFCGRSLCNAGPESESEPPYLQHSMLRSPSAAQAKDAHCTHGGYSREHHGRLLCHVADETLLQSCRECHNNSVKGARDYVHASEHLKLALHMKTNVSRKVQQYTV